MQKELAAIRWTFTWISRLSLLTLIAPFVWLEVDPLSSHWRMMHAPDVWLLGGYIFGKDILWSGILFAWIAQLCGILLFRSLIRQARRQRAKPGYRRMPLNGACLLLAVFPLWMYAYVDGVIGNSDGVRFITHYGVGWALYLGIAYLTVRLFRHTGVRA